MDPTRYTYVGSGLINLMIGGHVGPLLVLSLRFCMLQISVDGIVSDLACRNLKRNILANLLLLKATHIGLEKKPNHVIEVWLCLFYFFDINA